MPRRDQREVGGARTTFQTHAFVDPAPDLAAFVARHWIVRWDLNGQSPYQQLIVPYPQAHLSWVNDDPPLLHGVARGHVFRTLSGAGRVLGMAFRPGGLRPFLDRPMSTFTGQTVPAADVLGAGVPLGGDGTDDELIGRAEAFLRRRLPPVDPMVDEIAAIVALIEGEPEIARVETLADRLGASVRALQRLFGEYVGVPPKWVIRRYRLHAVTRRLASGDNVHWGQLAAELGYADQAHLTRDFTAMFGETPTHYAQRYPG